MLQESVEPLIINAELTNQNHPMYCDDPSNHGLPFDPFKAIITPRPIGWISTVDKNGTPNIAPYSFFNAVPAGENEYVNAQLETAECKKVKAPRVAASPASMECKVLPGIKRS